MNRTNQILTIAALAVVLAACSREAEESRVSGPAPDEKAATSADSEGLAKPVNQGVGADESFMRPRGASRRISFETTEGTEMSIDVSPDGSWLVFDLLGHVYRMPVGGGQAVSLTQGSGIALNFHPRISPDGSKIAFVSDRAGQNNLWVMDADGGNPQAVFLDKGTRMLAPAWHPDGQSIVALRAFRTPGRGWHRRVTGIWNFPLDGSNPSKMLGDTFVHYYEPTYSADGRYLYFHTGFAARRALPLEQIAHRLQRLEIASGVIENLRPRPDDSAVQTSEETADTWALTFAKNEDPYPAEISPAVSPDGNWVAFAAETPGEPARYRGHAFDPGTGLFLKNLATGEERRLVDQITKDLTSVHAIYSYRHVPAFDWSPDGAWVYFTQDGKIRRVAVADGSIETIPFTAQVEREISEQARGRIDFEDESFRVKFIQWPAGSPDGKRVTFVAAGRIWIMDLPDGDPRPLTDNMGNDYQFTPAWSADGSTIVFTAWNDMNRGHLYSVSANGGTPVRLTRTPGEYIYPALAPDGETIAVVAGPGPAAAPHTGGWNGWDAPKGWHVLTLPAAGGEAVRGC